MVSEVERIMQIGELVGKVNDVDTKAMGVSTTNLMPDEKGEVPLSKQSAFQIENVMASVQSQVPTGVELSTQPVQVENTIHTAPTEPATSVQNPTAVMPEISASTTAPSVPTAIVNETISENPVDVVAPTGLGGLDFTSVIPDIPLVTDSTEPAVSEEKQAVPSINLPTMPDKILAEEPKGVNNDLFVDGIDNVFGKPQPVETNNMNTVLSGTPTMNGVDQATITPIVENQPQSQLETITHGDNSIPTLETQSLELTEPKVEVPFEALDISEPTKVEPTAPVVGSTQPEMPKTSLFENSEVTLTQPEILDTPNLETTSGESMGTQTTEEASKASYDEEKKKEIMNAEKLDAILDKLSLIEESLKSIDSKINLKETITQELPQNDNVQIKEQNSTTGMKVPSMESVPTTELTQRPIVQEKVDALGQINGEETVPAVDEAPIIGGRFI